MKAKLEVLLMSTALFFAFLIASVVSIFVLLAPIIIGIILKHSVALATITVNVLWIVALFGSVAAICERPREERHE